MAIRIPHNGRLHPQVPKYEQWNLGTRTPWINLPNSVQQAQSKARVQTRRIRCRDLAYLHKPSAAIVAQETSRFQRRNGPSRSSEYVRNPQKSGTFFSTSQTPKSASMVRSDVASASQGCTSPQSPEERNEKGRKQNDQDELKNVRQTGRGLRGGGNAAN